MSCFLSFPFSIPTLALYPSFPLLHKADPGKHYFSYYSLIIPLTGEPAFLQEHSSPSSCLPLEVCLSPPRVEATPRCVVPFAFRPRHSAPLTEGIHTYIGQPSPAQHSTAQRAPLDLLLLARLFRISCFGPPPGRWFSPVQLLPTYSLQSLHILPYHTIPASQARETLSTRAPHTPGQPTLTRKDTTYAPPIDPAYSLLLFTLTPETPAQGLPLPSPSSNGNCETAGVLRIHTPVDSYIVPFFFFFLGC